MKARLKGVMLGLAVGGTLAGTLAVSSQAMAQDAGTDAPVNPSCTDTTMFPNPIFVTGSTAFEPVVQAMAFKLNSRTAGSGKVTLLYAQGSGSCAGVSTIKDNTDLPPGNLAHYYTTEKGAGGRLNCTVPAGIKADVAISDVFYETCGYGTKPATIGDFPGPAQAMLIIVPASAGSAVPLSITAEEAADVWGCGMRGQVAPWVVENSIQQRNQGSGTQNIIARAIGVLASAFHGAMNSGSGDMVKSVGTPMGAAEATIGFLAADVYSATSPPSLKALAFRGIEQTQAYYADSAPDTFDKRNTRDGHYLPWGYEHVIVRIDATTGKPTTPQAQNFLDWVLDNATTADSAPNFDPPTVEAASNVIPLCAMKVKRSSDGGFLSSYTSANPCSCLFEATATGAAPASCVACTDDSPCTNGTHCHHGYCE
jgi:ABC-type phosphate transport system substrate-binding protein